MLSNWCLSGRYRDELVLLGVGGNNCGDSLLPEHNLKAVISMVKFAGHTISVSGSTLVVSLLGLLAFPLNFIQSIGVGSAVALTVALTVNLTLVPGEYILDCIFLFVFSVSLFINSYVRNRGVFEVSPGNLWHNLRRLLGVYASMYLNVHHDHLYRYVVLDLQ